MVIYVEVVYKKNDISISNLNTLILGADIALKNDIKKELSKKYSVVDTTFKFKKETVGEAIENYNFNLNYIQGMGEKKICDLTFSEYYYLAIILKISDNPNLLIVDNLFGYLNNNQKNNIIKICEKNRINLIVFDNEFYYAYMSYEVIVIHDKKLAIKGNFKEVVKEEKILKRLGYKLPFYVDLSHQLMLYGLVDHLCYSLEELEGNLWN